MEAKFLFTLLIATVLLLASFSIVGAETDLIIVTDRIDFTKSKNSASFEIRNLVDESVNLTFTPTPTNLKLEDDEGNKITISFDTIDPVTLEAAGDKDNSVEITAEMHVDEEFDYKDLDLGSHLLSTLTIDATGVDSSDKETETVKFYFVNGFCKSGERGELEILEVEDKELDNEDEWEWAPLDDVQFRVEVYNDFDDKERIKVEYEIYDEDNKKVDFDEDNNEQSVSIDEGDSEKVTFSLRVPADVDDGNYKLFLKAYVKGHEDDEGCVDSSGELSDTYYQRVSIDRDEDRAVVVDMDKLDLPDFVMCGDFVTVYAKVYNIGVEDEDKVKVNLFNSDLGIDLDEVVNDLEEGESATLTFNFQIPENIEEKNYFFRLITFYDYEEDDDEYDSNSKEDLDESFNFVLKVNCVTEPESKISIVSAELEQEEVFAGEEMTVNLVIKNTGEETSALKIVVEDYESWATEKQVSPRELALESEDSKDVSISLDVDKEASGLQTFKVKILSDDQVLEEKELEVFVETKAVKGITGDVVAGHLRENWFIWIIIVINIILIIAIIAVARRIVTTR